jgi:predicted nucleic acid-binding protein
MNEKICLLDTDILSYLLKQKSPAYNRGCQYLAQTGVLTISCMTYYECIRGYQAIGAFKKLEVFYELMPLLDVVYLDEAILQKAADIYAYLKQQGRPTGEYDLLIGATALAKGMTLVTNNERHYQFLQESFGLSMENWMKA